MLESYTLSDLVPQRSLFAVRNCGQVYREMTHFLVSVVYYTFLKK